MARRNLRSEIDAILAAGRDLDEKLTTLNFNLDNELYSAAAWDAVPDDYEVEMEALLATVSRIEGSTDTAIAKIFGADDDEGVTFVDFNKGDGRYVEGLATTGEARN